MFEGLLRVKFKYLKRGAPLAKIYFLDFKEESMIKLGQKVKDKITGFTGVVMGRTEYLYGCVSVAVLSTKLKDDKPKDWVWFDEQRLTLLSKAKSGGPQPEAPSR